MKIILISFYNRFYEYSTMYSLASLRIASVLCSYDNATVEIIPFNLDSPEDAITDIYNKIIAEDPDVIGMSAYVWTWDYAKKIRNLFNDKISPLFVIGGPEVSNRSQDGWRGNEIFVSGEGEQFWMELYKLFISGVDFRNLSRTDSIGLCNKESFYYVSNAITMNFGIPINSPTFMRKVKGYECSKDFIWFETSRGCPFNCGYCGHKTRKGVCSFDIDFISQEIRYIGLHKIKKVFVVDPIIGGTQKRGKEVFNLFQEYAPDTAIIAYLRPEYLDSDYIEILSNSNIEEIRIGIQTLSDTVPKWIRFNSIKHIINLLPQLKEHGIPWRAELIVGLPGDTITGFLNSLERVINLIHPTYVYAYHLSVLKETPLWNLVENNDGEWLRVGDNGISATCSYSYTEQEMKYMLDIADSITKKYNSNVINVGRKYYNISPDFEHLLEDYRR